MKIKITNRNRNIASHEAMNEVNMERNSTFNIYNNL